MHKIKVTKKSIKDNYNAIIEIGYCDAQYLLQFEKAFAYSTRSEGWACDYYKIGNIIISTGYAPIKSKNAKVNCYIMMSLNDKAREIIWNYNLSYQDQVRQVKLLLKEFINSCITEREEIKR